MNAGFSKEISDPNSHIYYPIHDNLIDRIDSWIVRRATPPVRAAATLETNVARIRELVEQGLHLTLPGPYGSGPLPMPEELSCLFDVTWWQVTR